MGFSDLVNEESFQMIVLLGKGSSQGPEYLFYSPLGLQGGTIAIFRYPEKGDFVECLLLVMQILMLDPRRESGLLL